MTNPYLETTWTWDGREGWGDNQSGLSNES